MANEIVTEIRLELDKFRADLNKASKEGEDTGKKIGNDMGSGAEAGLSKAIGGVSKVMLAAAAAAVAGTALILREAVQQASEQQVAINGLNSAMAVAGTYTADASQHFQEFAAQLQKTSTVADDVILKGGSLLVTLGKLSGEGLDRAAQAAVDFAAGMAGQGMSTESAFNLVAKAAAGNVEALSRYGIRIKSTGDATKDFQTALGELEKRFKGMAELQTNTFDGAMKQTQNAFADVLKEIGKVITNSPTMIALIRSVADAFAAAAVKLAEWSKGRDLIKEVGLEFVKMGIAVATYVMPPLELAFNTIKTGTLAISTGIAAIGQALGLVSGDQVTALADKTAQAANNVFDFSATSAADGFLLKAQEFFTAVQPPITDGFKNIADASKAAVGDPGFWTTFADSFVAGTKRMADASKDLGGKVAQTIGTGVTNAFASMGAAMVKGENGMEAFGKAMLSVLGDIAIQFGATFIAMGVGKILLGDPTGIGLIAAGAALSVIGGALKGVGGMTTQSDNGNAGGGVAAGGGTGAVFQSESSQQAVQMQERGQVGTSVQVNIEGNVFDRRETGLQIADAINEAFGSNGVTFATAAQ